MMPLAGDGHPSRQYKEGEGAIQWAKCGYCDREVWVTIVWPGAKPSCGAAECLLKAQRDSLAER